MAKVVPIFYGTVTNGKMTVEDKKGLEEHIASLDGDVQITVEKKRKKRTVRQNRYYWLMLKWIGDELGYTPDEMHSIFGQMFLLVRDGKFSFVRSTKSLSTMEQEEYHANIRQYCALELKLDIPEPNELTFADRYQITT